MASSGRFSKYPKVNRSIPAAPASAADRLALASAPPAAAVAAPKPVVAAPVVVPALEDMTVAEVLEWVGDDDKRREAALAAEQDGRARKGLIKTLSE
jgi:hypothetical protein